MNAVRASIMLGIAGCSYGLSLLAMRLVNMAGYFREDLMVSQYLLVTLQVPVGITAIMTGMELPATLVFGTLLVGETRSPLAILGAALICTGIVVANWEAWSSCFAAARKRSRDISFRYAILTPFGRFSKRPVFGYFCELGIRFGRFRLRFDLRFR